MPRGTVPRRRLLSAIESDIHDGYRVVVVSGPAGTGKTSLLAQCAHLIAGEDDVVAWVTVGRGEEPVRFWTAVRESLRMAVNARGQPKIRTTVSDLRPRPEQFATLLGEILRVQAPTWLIIDDAHELTDQSTWSYLITLADIAPDSLRIVIGSRYTPQIPLARWSLEGRAREFRYAELAFDDDETRILMEQHHLVLDADDLKLLTERTEGWPAGLRLAALAMANHDDPAEFIRSFAGDDHSIADYLVSEILVGQPSEVIDFLLETSVPNSVNAELARVLTGRDDAGAILEVLEQANALVQSDPGKPGFYRYHRLLRTYLLAELTRRSAQRHRELAIRAAEWFSANGDPERALQLAGQVGDAEFAARLLDRHAVRLLLSDGPAAVRQLLAVLPADFHNRRRIALIAQLVALEEGDLEQARSAIYGSEPDDHRGGPRGRLTERSVALFEARLGGDSDRRLADLMTVPSARVTDPDVTQLWRFQCAEARIVLGEYLRAEAGLLQLLRAAQRTGRAYLELMCLSRLSMVAGLQCDETVLAERAEQAAVLAEKHGWSDSVYLAFPHAALARLAWRAGDVVTAMHHAEAAGAAADADLDVLVETAVTRSRALVDVATRTDPAEAIRTLRQGWRRTKRIPPVVIAADGGAEIDLAIRLGMLDWAEDVVQVSQERLGDAGDPRVFRALLHVHNGRDAAARRELAPVLAGVARCLAPRSRVIAWGLSAHLADQSGEQANAHQALLQGLDIAAPRSMVGLLCEVSGPVRSLMVRNRGRFGAHEKPVADALARDAASPMGVGTAPLVAGEALTVRELDLLRDLPSLLSLDEIATAHVVSVNTVKTHLKAVYRKLGAGSRREAVARAREIGILVVAIAVSAFTRAG